MLDAIANAKKLLNSNKSVSSDDDSEIFERSSSHSSSTVIYSRKKPKKTIPKSVGKKPIIQKSNHRNKPILHKKKRKRKEVNYDIRDSNEESVDESDEYVPKPDNVKDSSDSDESDLSNNSDLEILSSKRNYTFLKSDEGGNGIKKSLVALIAFICFKDWIFISKERRDILRNLRLAGNNRYNTDPTIYKTGKLLVTRRISTRNNNKTKKTNGENFDQCASETLTEESDIDEKMRSMKKQKNDQSSTYKKMERIKCKECFEYISRRNISHHISVHHIKDKYNGPGTVRDILAASRQETRYHHELACERYATKILPLMRESELLDVNKYDLAITLVGNALCERHDIKDQDELIRGNVRLLGRFLLAIKEKNGSRKNYTDLVSCMKTECWTDVVSSVRQIGKFGVKKERYFDAPAPAQQLGFLLKNTAFHLKSHYLQTKEKKKRKEVAEFELEFESHWRDQIGSKIASSQKYLRRIKCERQKHAVSKTDKKIFLSYLDKKRRILFGQIKSGFDDKMYYSLQGVEMTYLLLYNA
ncbi:hypothetical protein TKK_0016652 [Trichogramma kaykai]